MGVITRRVFATNHQMLSLFAALVLGGATNTINKKLILVERESGVDALDAGTEEKRERSKKGARNIAKILAFLRDLTGIAFNVIVPPEKGHGPKQVAWLSPNSGKIGNLKFRINRCFDSVEIAKKERDKWLKRRSIRGADMRLA